MSALTALLSALESPPVAQSAQDATDYIVKSALMGKRMSIFLSLFLYSTSMQNLFIYKDLFFKIIFCNQKFRIVQMRIK